VVSHLVIDFVRRAARFYLGCGVLTMLVWAGVGATGPRGALAGVLFSMVFAYVAGPVLALGLFAPREVALLSIPRRTLWQAQWLLGTLVAAGWLALAKAIGFAGAAVLALRPRLDWELVALSTLCDVAYAGLFFALMSLLQVRSAGPMLYPVVVVLFVGGVAWPFLLQSYVPATWDALSGPSGVIVSVGLLATVVSYFHEPAAGPRSAIARTATPSILRSRDAADAQLHRRPTGMTLLLLRRAAGPFGFVAGGYCVIILLILVVSLVEGEAARAEFASVLREYDRASLPFGYAVGVLPWIRGSWILPFLASGFGTLTPVARHLRALPIGRTRLTLCVLASALPAWIALVLVMSTLGLIVNGRTPDLPLGILVFAAGMTTFAHALQWRLGVDWVRMAWLPLLLATSVAAFVPLVPSSMRLFASPPVVGVAGLVLAIIVLQVSRQRANYRPDSAALEFAGGRG
jgi:hypothetical protein